MRSRAPWPLLALALVAIGGDVSAQEPVCEPLSRLAFHDPPVASAAREAPVETLTRMTGENAAEFGRESEPDEIETDRDSFTPATTTAGRRRFIAESAYSVVDNRGIKETHSAPELIVRYGLTDRIELRLGWNYEVGGTGNETSGSVVSEAGPAGTGSRLIREYSLAYGVKVQVTGQQRWVPQSALVVQGFTPTGGSAGTSTVTDLAATYVAGWRFADRWKFDAAIRYGTSTEDGDHFNLWAPSAVLKVPLGEKWAGHVEYFGLFSTGKERNFTKHFVSPGLHYLITPNLEVGFRLGWGLNEQSARFFSNVGVGWRF